ncbi:MAG: 3-keto-5-aminohexanoate cleavage protein [Candidatus Saccharibacteria bacterium]
MQKVIINLCPTGMVGVKSDNPNIPITPNEIIADVLACADLGVSIAHIHAREENGKPSWRKEIVAEIIAGIREKNDSIILNTTTSGRDWGEFEKRSDCLDLSGDLKPDMASLTIGSMNFIKSASINEPDMIERLAIKMKEKGIKPELEVFEPGMVNKANYLIQKGIIDSNSPYFNILLGSLGTSPLTPISLASFISQLPQGAVWSLAGIGNYQLDANLAAISFGGGVRIGLEDNNYLDREKNVLATNVALVERITKFIRDAGLEIATPQEARVILGV